MRVENHIHLRHVMLYHYEKRWKAAESYRDLTRGWNCSSIRRTLPPKRQQIITSTDRSRTGKWEKFMKTWTNWWMMLKRGLLQKIVISLPVGSTFCRISGRQLLKWVAITLLNKLFIVYFVENC